MVKIPKPEESPHASRYILNMTNIEEGRRSRRIGMATLGGKCTRAMWLKFRWARYSPLLNRRVRRIFRIGDAIEDLVIAELTDIGMIITKQQEPVEGWGGHIFGYTDGRVTNVPEAPKTEHLLEVKSMNDRNFQQLKKKGVKLSKFEHYIQMQAYMGKLELTRALYAVYNKNDSEIYIERVHFDRSDYKHAMSRAVDVVSSETMPPNIINDPKNFACKWCDFIPICYEGFAMDATCRSCSKVDIEDNGKWSCRLHNKKLTFEEQEAGCEYYRPIE